ncbi:GFA family protein [Parasedimentitalea marina]|uniref:GFA family protein n=1 Tax=Parasedimentitalea marina TaxID=2483033 RepID=A0A3T0MY40_9RHOB|nr:GFA family protein [Parasedimentitalea marina]AZV76683.1 GFA family protein [Parasedimentitalea marina]
MFKGSCLCRAVTFTVTGDLKAPNACHCQACRKATGHYLVSTDVATDQLRITGKNHLRWYHSSDKVRRGFCASCGSTLFWDPLFHDWTAIAMGAFDTPTKTQMDLHIHVSKKGDYYDITDGLPQNQQ